MTDVATAVDTPRTVMWPVSQIAERDRVSRQAISKRVNDLVAKHGLAVERDARGRVARVNVAEYDHLRGRFDDPSKAQRPAAPESDPGVNDSYDEAQRQRAWYDAEKRRLELATLKSELVPVADIKTALAVAGARIVNCLDRLPALADELASAVARDGARGARQVLKAEVVRLRTEIADSLAVMRAEGEPDEA